MSIPKLAIALGGVGLAALAAGIATAATHHPPARAKGRVLSFSELVALADQAGFPDPALAAAVAMAESGGNSAAVGDGGTSFGLWQIHTPAHPQFDAGRLLEPAYNAGAAWQISRGGTDWTPWTTFTSGAYRRFYQPENA